MFTGHRHKRKTRTRIADKLRGLRRDLTTRDRMTRAHECSPQAYARQVGVKVVRRG